MAHFALQGSANPANRADGTGRFAPGPPLIGIAFCGKEADVNLDKFRGGVPADSLPIRLVELLAFQEAVPDWYNGSCRLSSLEYVGAEYFAGDSEAAKQFVVFGSGPDGSLYAFWLYPGRTFETAPVVFLGSDGGNCGVLAADLNDFLALLAFGADELGREVPSGEIIPSDKFEPSEEPLERQREFQDWLQQQYGIQVPAEPMDIVRRARSAHPDLDLWIREWQERRYGNRE